MSHRSVREIVYAVIVVVEYNGLAVSKDHLSEAFWENCDRQKAWACINFEIARIRIVSVWALNEIVRSWWMVSSLFKVDHGSILTNCLVSLTKNRVEWFLEYACIIIPVKRLDHYDLKAFQRVSK